MTRIDMTRHIGMNAHRDAKMEKHQYLLVPLASIWTMGRLIRVVILDVVVDMERRISKYEYYDHEYGTFYRSSYEIDCTCRKITNERERKTSVTKSQECLTQIYIRYFPLVFQR